MRIFITDCEGPTSKNDNAMELAAHFIPQGEGFFALLSKYDDYLAYVEKRPGYKAGDTLRLILPFLKAFGATDKKIEEYSRANILLMPGAEETLHFVRKRMPASSSAPATSPTSGPSARLSIFPLRMRSVPSSSLTAILCPPRKRGICER